MNNNFTVEETNLISIFSTETRSAAIGEMTAALSDMDSDMRELARRTLDKLHNLTDSEYSQLALDPAEDDG